jgi:hypothetical protein
MAFLIGTDMSAVFQRSVDDFFCHRSFAGNGQGLGVQPFGVTLRSLDEIRVGESVYPLRRQVRGAFTPDWSGGLGTFYVPSLPSVVGRGNDMGEALDDWQERLHMTVQSFLSKRPFEMSPEEREAWQSLREVIDISRYQSSTPLRVRQFGRVDDSRPRHHSIRWENGSKQRVRLDQMPPEFATYKAGQPFEAIVERDPVTTEFVRAVYVARRSERCLLSAEERRKLWDSLSTSVDLPEGDWD